MLRRKSLSGFVGVLLIINFLNVSIDPADPISFSGNENLAINDIESVVELVLEEVFGLTDSFKEVDDTDFDQTSHNTSIYFITPDKKELKSFDFGVAIPWSSYYNEQLPELLTYNFTPPPKFP